MNIFIETNFVQELVFLQEEFNSCEQILDLARNQNAKLIVPAFSLVEPIGKLHRQKNKRQEIQREMNLEIQQLSRTSIYSSRIDSMQQLDVLLSQSVEEEQNRFEDVKQRILQIAAIIPLTADLLIEADAQKHTYSLSFQDAIVLASVLSYLKASPSPSCFLNRNTKDFDNPDIRQKLESLGCRMIPRFDDGYNFILSKLK